VLGDDVFQATVLVLDLLQALQLTERSLRRSTHS
jgi:hypothetical protein